MTSLLELAAVKQGQALLELRRAEYKFNHPGPKGPEPISQALPEPRTPVVTPQPVRPQFIKIIPELGIASIRSNHTGAWRAWTLARYLDSQGTGRIAKNDLLKCLFTKGVGDRQRRRWLRDAIRVGLFKVYRDQYYLVGLGRAAVILGCDHIGKPAKISSSGLCGVGWRAHVWAGYLVTLGNRPISQAVKAQLTGIDPRTQRNYQAELPGEARKNYAKIKIKPGNVEGDREVNGRVVFTKYGQVFQRLPDIRLVPFEIAETCKRGQSKKAQAFINSSSLEGRGSEFTPRLFNASTKQAKATLRTLSRSDMTPPSEIFELLYAGNHANLYQAISI